MSELEVNFSKYGETTSEYYNYKRNERYSQSQSKERINDSSDSKIKDRESSAEKNRVLHLNLKKITGFDPKEKKTEEEPKNTSTSFTKDRFLGKFRHLFCINWLFRYQFE